MHTNYQASLCNQAANKHIASMCAAPAAAWPPPHHFPRLLPSCLSVFCKWFSLLIFSFSPCCRSEGWFPRLQVIYGCAALDPSWRHVCINTCCVSFMYLFVYSYDAYLQWPDVLCPALCQWPPDPSLTARVWTPTEPDQGLMMSILHLDLTAIKPPRRVCSHVCVAMCVCNDVWAH